MHPKDSTSYYVDTSSFVFIDVLLLIARYLETALIAIRWLFVDKKKLLHFHKINLTNKPEETKCVNKCNAININIWLNIMSNHCLNMIFLG